MHDALYDLPGGLSEQAIVGCAKRIGLDMNRFASDCRTTARDAVARDRALAKRAGVIATPTFVVLGPGGKVVRVMTIEQAEGLMR
jgi:protein-disulfide isomerase